MMFLFTILSVPSAILFYHGNLERANASITIDDYSPQGIQDLLSKFTFGNLGEGHTICDVQDMKSKKQPILEL